MTWQEIDYNLKWSAIYWDYLTTQMYLNAQVDMINARMDKKYCPLSRLRYVLFYDFENEKINTGYSEQDTRNEDWKRKFNL